MVAPAQLAAVDDVIQAEMERLKIPGLAVGVLQDGKTETRGYGVASLRTGQPVTADTLFQIGSITKSFTATLIMQLVDDGLLDLDAPVARAVPELRLKDAQALAGLTPRHLLAHTCGFYGDRFTDYGWGADALAKAIATFDELEQQLPPGELFSYANTGYQLLGRIVEKLREEVYETVARERLLKPLGMEAACFFAHEAIVQPNSVGHAPPQPGAELEIARPYPIPRAMNAAGAIIAPVGDLLRYAALHMSDGTVQAARRLLGEAPDEGENTRLLRADSLAAMQTGVAPTGTIGQSYALGWMVEEVDGVRLVSHGGSTNGFRAHLLFAPRRQAAIAWLSNSPGGATAWPAVRKAWLTRALGLTVTEPAAVTLSGAELLAYAGEYARPNQRITVTAQDGGLSLTVDQVGGLDGKRTVLPPISAEPLGEGHFRLTSGDAIGNEVQFLTSRDGRRFLRFGLRLVERT
jgi:CubicO group peptidase (beta-lactamase class C family)